MRKRRIHLEKYIILGGSGVHAMFELPGFGSGAVYDSKGHDFPPRQKGCRYEQARGRLSQASPGKFRIPKDSELLYVFFDSCKPVHIVVGNCFSQAIIETFFGGNSYFNA